MSHYRGILRWVKNIPVYHIVCRKRTFLDFMNHEYFGVAGAQHFLEGS